MAGAVDFSEWVAPDLIMTATTPQGEKRTYSVSPPSVRRAKLIIAAAARAEVNLGIVKGEVPKEIIDILATIQGVERPGLGPVAQELQDDDIAVETIDRMEYYAIFYWARGKQYADALAVALWARRADTGEGEPTPKA